MEIPVIIAIVLPELQVFNFLAFRKESYIAEVFKGNFNYFEMALAILVGINACIIHCLLLSKSNKMGLGMFGGFTQRRKGAKKSWDSTINRINFVKLEYNFKSITMLKSYFITAYRNIKRNKFYSALNIFGPAIGITCAILILGFAYRMEFGFSPFVLTTLIPFVVSLLITLVIAFFTISSLSVNAARANPINSLSRE